MHSRPRHSPRASRAQALSRAIAYDLGRTARQVVHGATTVVDAVRDATGKSDGGAVATGAGLEPRVELAFDPRARARGEFMPAALALKVGDGQLERVAWSSSVTSLEELARDLRHCLEALDASFHATPSDRELEETVAAVATLADVSGLTTALDHARRRLFRYDRDPTLALLASRLEALGPGGRRAWVERFVASVASAPALEQVVTSTGFRPVALGPDDLNALVPVVASAARESLFELGLDDRDLARLSAIGSDVSAPLSSLAELYLSPRTLGQHVKRGYRLHRITLAALRLTRRGSTRVG